MAISLMQATMCNGDYGQVLGFFPAAMDCYGAVNKMAQGQCVNCTWICKNCKNRFLVNYKSPQGACTSKECMEKRFSITHPSSVTFDCCVLWDCIVHFFAENQYYAEMSRFFKGLTLSDYSHKQYFLYAQALYLVHQNSFLNARDTFSQFAHSARSAQNTFEPFYSDMFFDVFQYCLNVFVWREQIENVDDRGIFGSITESHSKTRPLIYCDFPLFHFYRLAVQKWLNDHSKWSKGDSSLMIELCIELILLHPQSFEYYFLFFDCLWFVLNKKMRSSSLSSNHSLTSQASSSPILSEKTHPFLHSLFKSIQSSNEWLGFCGSLGRSLSDIQTSLLKSMSESTTARSRRQTSGCVPKQTTLGPSESVVDQGFQSVSESVNEDKMTQRVTESGLENRPDDIEVSQSMSQTEDPSVDSPMTSPRHPFLLEVAQNLVDNCAGDYRIYDVIEWVRDIGCVSEIQVVKWVLCCFENSIWDDSLFTRSLSLLISTLRLSSMTHAPVLSFFHENTYLLKYIPQRYQTSSPIYQMIKSLCSENSVSVSLLDSVEAVFGEKLSQLKKERADFVFEVFSF